MKILPYVALGLFLVACTQVSPPAENTHAANGAVVKDAANSTGAGNAVKNSAPSEISAPKNTASANVSAKNSTASSMREIWRLLENADRALLAKEISRAEELAARAQELSELKRIEVGRIFSRFIRARIALQRGDTDAAISLATDASSMQSGVAEIHADAVNYESAYTSTRLAAIVRALCANMGGRCLFGLCFYRAILCVRRRFSPDCKRSHPIPTRPKAELAARASICAPRLAPL